MKTKLILAAVLLSLSLPAFAGCPKEVGSVIVDLRESEPVRSPMLERLASWFAHNLGFGSVER